MSKLNAAAFLMDNNSLDSDTAVFVAGSNRSHSHGELKKTAEMFGRYLVASGIEKGSRVVICGHNSFFWLSTYLGTLLAGCVAVPVPPSKNNISEMLDYIEPALVAIDSTLNQQIHELAERLPQNRIIVSEKKGAEHRELMSFGDACRIGEASKVPFPATDGSDLSALMLTSGSTGAPRAVMISHENTIANTESIVSALKLTTHDRMMVILPFAYCYGLSLFHTHLKVGASIVLGTGTIFAMEQVFKEIEEAKCTSFAAVPSHFQIFLRSPSESRPQVPSCLKHMSQAGGRLAPELIMELRNSLPDRVQIHIMYGQTEATARLSCLDSSQLSEKVGSIGRGIPGVKLEVVKDDGYPAKPGEAGEIIARSKGIALGYWKDPEATEKTFRNGALYTGDIATVDSDGFIYILDRKKDFLKCAGVRVSCREIEDTLLQCPDLVEAVVVGIADEISGEAVMLFAVVRDTNDSAAKDRVKKFCAKRLRSELVPRRIEFMGVEDLPRSTSGKVLKRELKDMAVRLTTGIKNEKVEMTIPLSYSEVRNYLLREPGGWANNMYLYSRTSSALNEDAFSRALAMVISRHQDLRASYLVNEDGRLTKLIRDQVQVPLFKVTVQSEAEELEVARGEIGRNFNIGDELLIRATIITRENKTAVLLVVSHLVFDSSSARIFTADLEKAYKFAVNNEPFNEPLPALTTKDYAVWEHQWVLSDDAKEHLDFWKERLSTEVPLLVQRVRSPRAFVVTPGFNPQPEHASFMLMKHFKIEADTLKRLRDLGNKLRCPTSSIVISALVAITFQRSFKTENALGNVTFGQLLDLRNTYSSHNQNPEIHKVIGCLYNVLFLSVSLSREMNLKTVLSTVDAEITAVAEHSALPLVPILTLRQANEAFHTIVSYVRSPATLRLPGVPMEDVPREVVESGVWKGKLDTSWILNESQTQISGYLVANTVRWSQESVDELIKEYINMIERFSSDSDSLLG